MEGPANWDVRASQPHFAVRDDDPVRAPVLGWVQFTAG